MISLLLALLVAGAAPAQSMGHIAGHVSTTGEPGLRLARAYVSLISVDESLRRLTMTRDDGTFVFEAVPPGAYVVEAGKLPHVGSTQHVTLAKGQSIGDLVFRLKRSGVISGHVLDERGQPPRDTRVDALRVLYARGGTMTTAAGQATTTDRFGRYRIHGLAPGAYVVATSPAVLQIGSTSFVPGVTRADAATVLVVEDGTEHTNVAANLMPPSLDPPRTFGTVSGVVLGPDGQPVDADVTFNYGPMPVRMSVSLRRVRANGGQFVFDALVVGAVRLTATVPGQALQASHDLTLSGEPVSGITLRLFPPVKIAGRAMHGGTPLSGRTLVVRSHGGPSVETREIRVGESGDFQLSLFPGRYVIESGSSVTIDGRDMTDRVIEIRPDVPITSLVVSFSEAVQDITGRVINGDGVGVNTVTMVAFSTFETDWFHQSRRVATAEPAADGRYQLGAAGAASLPAGEYYLAAVTDLSADAQYNPAFLRTLIEAAIRINLAPGQQVVQNVRVR